MEMIAYAMAWAGTLWGAYLGYVWWTNPDKALRLTTHRAENLPRVMGDRHIGSAVLALGVLLFGSLKLLAFLFAAGAVMAFGDSVIYARAGKPHAKHTATGIFAAIGLAITLIALVSAS